MATSANLLYQDQLASLSPDTSGSGSTLDSLGSFFGQLGGAVSSVYKAVNAPSVQMPTTQLPMTSTLQTTATSFFSSGIGSILLLVAIGFAVALGIRAVRKK